jgi:hypothetical protein
LLANLASLVRYRGLIQSLVARELKARYRGSVLGFVWSFVNPLLLLLIYSFVFTTVMPNNVEGVQPYALFMFCGILPWNWFATSLSDAAGSLIGGGNLIKKVLFPAEVLPLVSVFTNMVHFFLGLPILIVFLFYFRRWPDLPDLFWFPVTVLVQLIFTTSLALTPSSCRSFCAVAGKSYAGLQFGSECWCGSTNPANANPPYALKTAECTTPCGGDAAEKARRRRVEVGALQVEELSTEDVEAVLVRAL